MNEKTDRLLKRDYTYDWVRLIATILVVIGHSTYLSIQSKLGGVTYDLGPSINPAYDSGILSFFNAFAGWTYGFHMPLFFMLSGAVLALKPLAPMDQIVKKKIKRLIIPYYVYGWLFMLPVKWIAGYYDKNSFVEALRAFLSGGDCGHLWFLIALFWAIIVFAAIVKIFERLHVKSIYVLLFTCGIIQILYARLPFDILGLQKGLSYLFYFALGYCFQIKRARNDKWNIRKMLFVFLILVGVELASLRYTILDSFFTIIVGCFLVYIISDILNRYFSFVYKTKVWKVFMRNLFYIYLFHDPLEYCVLKIFFENNLLSSAFGCYMYTFSRFIIVMIVCIILGETVEFLKKRMKIVLA